MNAVGNSRLERLPVELIGEILGNFEAADDVSDALKCVGALAATSKQMKTLVERLFVFPNTSTSTTKQWLWNHIEASANFEMYLTIQNILLVVAQTFDEARQAGMCNNQLKVRTSATLEKNRFFLYLDYGGLIQRIDTPLARIWLESTYFYSLYDRLSFAEALIGRLSCVFRSVPSMFGPIEEGPPGFHIEPQVYKISPPPDPGNKLRDLTQETRERIPEDAMAGLQGTQNLLFDSTICPSNSSTYEIRAIRGPLPQPSEVDRPSRDKTIHALWRTLESDRLRQNPQNQPS